MSDKKNIAILLLGILFALLSCNNKKGADFKKQLDSISLYENGRAINDFNNRSLFLEMPELDSDKKVCLIEVLQKQYGFKTVEIQTGLPMDCIIAITEQDKQLERLSHSSDSVYFHKTKNLLESKFGITFFDVLKKKTDSLHSHFGSCIPTGVKFIGGNDSLKNMILKLIVYPESAIKDGVEGIVYTKLNFNSTGTLINAIVVKGVRKDLDYEALAVIKKLPKRWLPSKNIGKQEIESFMLPIKFKLK